jgi:hypothetical protein
MSRVADILLAQANAAGRAAEQRANVWGSAIQNISAIPGQVFQQRRADSALALKQKQEQDQIDLARQREVREGRSADVEMQQHLAQLETMRQKRLGDQAEKLLIGKASPEEIQAFVADETMFTPNERARLLPVLNQPDGATRLLTFLAPKETFTSAAPGSMARSTRTQQTVPGSLVPEKPLAPSTASVALAAAGGDPQAQAAMDLLKPPAPPKNVQSDAFMLDGKPVKGVFDPTSGTYRYNGEDVTARAKPIPAAAIQMQNQLTADAKNAPSLDASRPDPATANIPEPKTGLTPNALYQGAVIFALEGKPPAVGIGSNLRAQNVRAATQNKAAAIAAAAGVDLPTVQAEYRANSTALNKLLPQAKATATAANTAIDNLELAARQSATVVRAGSKLANRYLQWAQGSLTPAAGLTKFETYVYTAAREYAKVTSGGAASAQGLTDSAAREAEKLLSTTQSAEAFTAAAQAMKDDMSNVIGEQSKTLAGVSSTIANFFSVANGGGAVAAPAPQAATGAIVVTAPDGSKHPFDTQAQANAFKKLAGIK